jgi:hypothetical protein
MNLDISKQRLLRLGEIVFKGAFAVLLVTAIGIFVYYGVFRPRFPDLQHGFVVLIKIGAGRIYVTQYEANLEYYLWLSFFLCAIFAKACEIRQKK